MASVHDYFSWGIDLVIVLQFSSLLILAEAADIPKDVMRICVAICLIYCIVLSAGPLIWENMPDWDADAKVQLLFFANMAPKSQFVSAYGTMAVLLTKAAVSTIVQKHLGLTWFTGSLDEINDNRCTHIVTVNQLNINYCF